MRPQNRIAGKKERSEAVNCITHLPSGRRGTTVTKSDYIRQRPEGKRPSVRVTKVGPLQSRQISGPSLDPSRGSRLAAPLPAFVELEAGFQPSGWHPLTDGFALYYAASKNLEQARKWHAMLEDREPYGSSSSYPLEVTGMLFFLPWNRDQVSQPAEEQLLLSNVHYGRAVDGATLSERSR
jgi:hypothetical protein